MAKSDIVFGSEFSPSVVDLPTLIELAHEHVPNLRELQDDIERVFFPDKKKPSDRTKRLGYNTITSLKKYGLIVLVDTEAYELTPFGSEVFSTRHDEKKLQRLMGRHCLQNLRGIQVIRAISELSAAGIQLKKVNIANRLREEGLHISENGKHLNVLRQWMEFSGVLNPRKRKRGEALWIPDEARVKDLLGITLEDADKWSDLTQPQRDFARAFALMNVDTAKSSEVRDEAKALYGTEFPEGGLPQSVLHQLQEVGLIEWEKTTSGRGAKAHLVKKTSKLKNELLGSIFEQIVGGMGSAYRRLFRMSFTDILATLESLETHEKGIALEALAFYFMRRLDLKFVKWRYRGSQTGGAEVDLIVESDRLVFSRWQIQCKNTRQVRLDDLAKEVGVATAIRSNVVMLITTGKVGDSVRTFANQVMRNTALHVILLGQKEIDTLIDRPAALAGMLNQQASSAMQIKRHQIEEN